MKLTPRALGCLVVLAISAAGCSKSKPPPIDSPGKVRVVATIFPIADLLRQVGGQRVEVSCMLAAGRSPHGYQAKAEHVETLNKANLLFMVGLGVDEWARRAARTAGSGQVRVVELAKDRDFKGVYDQFAKTYPTTAPHAQHATDPHVWLDPVFMQSFLVAAVGELVKADPLHAEDYRTAGLAYLASLQKLDEDYRSTIGLLKHKHFLTYHPAFTYVARRYGLTQFALDEIGLGAISPEHLEKVLKFLKEHQVKAIFVEPQFPAERIESLAKQTGASVGRLDPLGNPDRKGYDSYLAMMRSNLLALQGALGD